MDGVATGAATADVADAGVAGVRRHATADASCRPVDCSPSLVERVELTVGIEGHAHNRPHNLTVAPDGSVAPAMPGVSSGTKLPSPTNVTSMMLALVPSPPTPSYDRTAGKDGARQRGQSIGHRWRRR